MEALFFLCIRVMFAILIASTLGEKRRIGYGWSLALSIVSPVIGLIITLCSKKKSDDINFIEINKDDKK